MLHRRHAALRLVLATLIVAACTVGVYASSGSVAASSGATTSLWLQTMDSCKQALGSATYHLTGTGADLTVSTPAHSKRTVSNSGGCPLQQGNCASFTVGCIHFAGVPVPGTYRIQETAQPPGNSTNPLGYAPCQGGSACRSEVVDVSISSTGDAQATVTSVYPDGFTEITPSPSQHHGSSFYAATAADPIVIHDFGLGSGNCDGDGDADDHNTGGLIGHCQYLPESAEGSACPGGTDQTFPWTCAFTTSSSSSTTTTSSGSSTTTSSSSSSTTTSSSSSSTTTSSSSSTTNAGCSGGTTTFTGTSTGSSVSVFYTANSSTLCATLSWTGSVPLDLIIYTDGSGATVLAENTSGVSGETIGPIGATKGQTYKVKARPHSTGGSSTFTLTATS